MKRFLILTPLIVTLALVVAGCLNEAEERYNAGFAHHEQGRLQDAIAEYDEAIRLDPRYVTAYFQKGTAYAELGELERATEDFGQGIRLSPEYALAYTGQGDALVGLGRLEEAI